MSLKSVIWQFLIIFNLCIKFLRDFRSCLTPFFIVLDLWPLILTKSYIRLSSFFHCVLDCLIKTLVKYPPLPWVRDHLSYKTTNPQQNRWSYKRGSTVFTATSCLLHYICQYLSHLKMNGRSVNCRERVEKSMIGNGIHSCMLNWWGW